VGQGKGKRGRAPLRGPHSISRERRSSGQRMSHLRAILKKAQPLQIPAKEGSVSHSVGGGEGQAVIGERERVTSLLFSRRGREWGKKGEGNSQEGGQRAGGKREKTSSLTSLGKLQKGEERGGALLSSLPSSSFTCKGGGKGEKEIGGRSQGNLERGGKRRRGGFFSYFFTC